MKKLLLLSLTFVLAVFVNAQTVVEQPQFGMTTASNVQIEKIELTDSATVLWFKTKYTPGNWISIPKETFIQPVGSKDKLYIVSTDGIPMNEQYTMPSSGEVSYKLIFPKIDPSVSKLDYGEGNDGGTWFIYDIQLKPQAYKSIIPKKLNANWFRSDNAQWEISLMDSAAVYKSQVWKYTGYSEKEGLGTLKLKNGTNTLSLYIKPGEDGTCMIGETPVKMSKYTPSPDESAIPVDKEEFSLPVFKSGTATYCGYVKNFSKRYPRRTGLVYVNDVLLGNQVSYSYTISDDGYFEVKIPLSNPQIIMDRGPFGGESVFAEPGKTLFQLIDNRKPLFMGDNARVNTDLIKVKNINSFNYNEMREKILDFTPEQYKLFCENSLIRDLNRLREYSSNRNICEKANKLKNMELNYRSAMQVLSYQMNFESAYRTKNKIPNTQREIPVKAVSPDTSYYSYLTPEFIGDPLAVMISDYYFFLNRLEFLEIVRPGMIIRSPSMAEITAGMEKAGVKLTSKEKELVSQMVEFETPEIKKIESDYQAKYGKQLTDYMRKYSQKLQPLFKDKNVSIVSRATAEEEFLMKEGVEFTNEEKELIAARKEMEKNPLIQKKNGFISENRDKISQFYNDHNSDISAYYRETQKAEKNGKLNKIFGIRPGLVTDIYNSQSLCQQMSREMIPIPDEKLKEQEKSFTIPFIAEYIKIKNDELKAKIEETKLTLKKSGKKSGFAIREVPKTEGDKVFEAIMDNYKGKVVFVDFWATWCGPCRSGIEQMKLMKEELASENIAFVYITNPSSPKNTYDNMIPGIKGEHYRLTQDEWNVVSGKFKISGIPHYTLVGKDGRIINPHLMYMNPESLKNMLMKYAKE